MASSKEHAAIRASLERYSKEELVDIMEHLLRIYVLNEPVKLESSIKKPDSVRDLSGYSFAQILSLLKTTVDCDELDLFRVTPITTYVTIGGMELDLNGPAPTLAAAPAAPAAEDRPSSDDDDDNLSPAERMDLDAKPWRSAPRPTPKVESKVETPSMADLFSDDAQKDRGFIMFDEPPRAAEEDDELPPPIADVAPGDAPVEHPSTTNDFAKAAASREDAPAAAPAQPPALAAGDKQIDPSNRFASLDLD